MAKSNAPSDLPGDELFEDDGFVVDFSSEEAAAENLVSEPVPSGCYYTQISKVDSKKVQKPGDNFNKWYLAMEFTVMEGPYAKRKVFTNVMLFPPALYTATKLMKAIGPETTLGEKTKIPGASYWLGKFVVVDGRVKPGNEGYGPRYEPNAFFDPETTKGKELRAKAANAPAGTAQSTSTRSTLLP